MEQDSKPVPNWNICWESGVTPEQGRYCKSQIPHYSWHIFLCGHRRK